MPLTNLPADVFLSILQSLDVKSILRMQRTCSSANVLIQSRFLWMNLFQNAKLPVLSAPNSRVDFQSLSLRELREAVVQPARFIERCLSGIVPYAHYRTVSLADLSAAEQYSPFSPFGTKNVKLFPGGRFMFVSNFRVAYIMDLQHRDKIIWSRVADYISRDRGAQGRFWISHIAYDCSEDGAIILAVVAKNVVSQGQYYCEVHRLRPDGNGWSKELVFSRDCSCRDDDELRVKGDFIILPCVGFLYIINWRTQLTVRVETPLENSVAEPLRLTLWRDHLFFISRTFFVVQEHRFNFKLNAIYLPSLFSDLTPGSVYTVLDPSRMSTFCFHNPENLTLVQLSDLTVQDLAQFDSRRDSISRMHVGAKFWDPSTRTSDFFSVYDIEFNLRKPLEDRFALLNFPRPQLHPLEEANTRIGYNAGLSSISSSKDGSLLYSTYRSQGLGRAHLYLSFVGLDMDGMLYFAQVKNDFTEYLAVNKSRCHVPIEQQSKSLVLLSADAKSVEIWHVT